MSQHEVITTSPVYLQLLREELIIIPGVTSVDLPEGGLPMRYPNGTGWTVWVDDTYNVPDVLTAVYAAVAAHVADPGPGPVGLTVSDLEEAWSQIGRKIAGNDPNLDFFKMDAVAFNASLESILGSASQLAINRTIGWMLYDVTRVLGMPMPANYDPYNEATGVLNPDGTMTWTPTGPPW